MDLQKKDSLSFYVVLIGEHEKDEKHEKQLKQIQNDENTKKKIIS